LVFSVAFFPMAASSYYNNYKHKLCSSRSSLDDLST
jgi:hypothetical protein